MSRFSHDRIKSTPEHTSTCAPTCLNQMRPLDFPRKIFESISWWYIDGDTGKKNLGKQHMSHEIPYDVSMV